jgi:hypothetical protein
MFNSDHQTVFGDLRMPAEAFSAQAAKYSVLVAECAFTTYLLQGEAAQ